MLGGLPGEATDARLGTATAVSYFLSTCWYSSASYQCHGKPGANGSTRKGSTRFNRSNDVDEAPWSEVVKRLRRQVKSGPRQQMSHVWDARPGTKEVKEGLLSVLSS